LQAEFLATTYRVDAPQGPIDLRIGQPSPLLDALLEHHRAVSWAFISGANPQAAEAPESVNAERHGALHAMIEAEGFSSIEGHGLPASDAWRPEPSWFVAGIALDHAITLARRFDQLALVAGLRHGCPRLIWC
jgi:hypothetical protein